MKVQDVKEGMHYLQADQAQRNYLMVYHMMLEAEALLRRQAGAGAEGIAAIYDAASKLVSNDMLLHLPLTKAYTLADLQVGFSTSHTTPDLFFTLSSAFAAFDVRHARKLAGGSFICPFGFRFPPYPAAP